jgi:hypothetical protein
MIPVSVVLFTVQIQEKKTRSKCVVAIVESNSITDTFDTNYAKSLFCIVKETLATDF